MDMGFHPRVSYIGRLRDRVGLAAAYLFMLGIGWSNGVIYLGMVVLIAATLADGRSFWIWARHSWAFWFVMGLSAYLLVRGQWVRPVAVPADIRTDELKDLLDIAGIPALALGWWCARYPRHWVRMMLVAAVGLIAGVLLHFDWPHLVDYLTLDRAVRIHLGGNGTGVFGGGLAIGALLVGIHYLHHARASGTRWYFDHAVVLLMCAFGIELLLMGHTRAAWLGLFVTMAVSVGIWLWRFDLGDLRRLFRQRWPVCVAVLVALAGLLVMVGEPLVNLLTAEREVWQRIVTLDIEGIQQSSLGLRITAWRIGMDAFFQYPLWGTGIGSTTEVLKQSDIPIGKILGHFHSLYLQVLVTTGIAGFLLSAAVVVTLGREAWIGRSLDAVSGVMARFAGLSAVYFGVVSLVVIRYDDPHGMAYMILIAACAVAPGMRRSLVERAEGKGLRGKG